MNSKWLCRVSRLLLFAYVAVFLLPAKISFSEEKISTTQENQWGLYTVIFEAVSGKIKVNLPNDVSAGDTISGTVMTEPSGGSGEAQQKNENELNGYVVEVENQKTPVGQKWDKWIIPAALADGAITVLLRKDGKEVAREEITPTLHPDETSTVAPDRSESTSGTSSGTETVKTPDHVETRDTTTLRTAAPEDFKLPEIGQAGRPVEILGPFDGDFTTSSLRVGDEEAKLLAESPRKLIAQTPTDEIGPMEIELKKKNVAARKEFHNIGIFLSATKTKLTKGEKSILTGQIEGLQGLRDPLKAKLENLSPGVITLEGGESQEILIDPQKTTPDGRFTFQRTLTGVHVGGFNILCTLLSGGKTDK